ncbi:unnamed protein product [Adineta steineri]|uniref:Apple domain-containing protein n=1 Tax=Adineta steineri TaxID=433720 RepID=A0A814YD54_9BILA|nr:unnamed protein product [Adineta steineri]CAF3679205.1 unnamed protein product [Adineta steineri]
MHCQSISLDWQSSMNLSTVGFQFLPINYQALFLSQINTKSLFFCAQACHSNGNCRIFDYDDQSLLCRLFEGNIITMGSIVASSSAQSRVGSKKYYTEQFINLDQSCSLCEGSRYMRCINNTCQCEIHTYFDGSICQSQKLFGDACVNGTECRSDLNYTCLPRQQCGPPSIQVGTVVAGNANGTSGDALNTLSYPYALTIGIDNSIYVSDFNNNRVLQFQEGSLTGSLVAGTGIAGTSSNQLLGPMGIYIDTSFNLYVTDDINYRLMFWPKNSSFGIRVAGSGSSGNTLSSFGLVGGIFLDSQKNIYVCDRDNNRIMRFSPNITDATIVAGTGVSGNGNQQLNAPFGLYFDEVNSYLYVSDSNNHRIQRYHVGVSLNGTTVAGGNGHGAGSNQLNTPYGLCISTINNYIYIIDSGNNRVQRWSFGATYGVTIVGNGAIIRNDSTSLQGATDVKLSINGSNLFVSETMQNRIWRFQLV